MPVLFYKYSLYSVEESNDVEYTTRLTDTKSLSDLLQALEVHTIEESNSDFKGFILETRIENASGCIETKFDSYAAAYDYIDKALKDMKRQTSESASKRVCETVDLYSVRAVTHYRGEDIESPLTAKLMTKAKLKTCDMDEFHARMRAHVDRVDDKRVEYIYKVLRGHIGVNDDYQRARTLHAVLRPSDFDKDIDVDVVITSIDTMKAVFKGSVEEAEMFIQNL